MKPTACMLGVLVPWLVTSPAHAEAEDPSALPSAVESVEDLEARVRELELRIEALRSERRQLCTATQTFTRGLTQGRVDARDLHGCVAPDTRRTLGEQFSGWRAATQAVDALQRYATGQLDDAPLATSGSGTPLETSLTGLIAPGPHEAPLLYRRLLVEAMELVAPEAWQRLREAGPAALATWFSDDAPLAPEILEEAQRDAEVQAHGGALSTALAMVRVYQQVARCHKPQPAVHACRRADQLAEVLESNEPLLLRRRTQDIWATDCDALDGDVLTRWIQDLSGASGTPSSSQSRAQVLEAADAKLFTCFLRDPEAGASFERWRTRRWPRAQQVSAQELSQLDQLRRRSFDDDGTTRCADALRALQTLEAPRTCTLASGIHDRVSTWAEHVSAHPPTSPNLELCQRFVQAHWEGKSVTIAPLFPQAPEPGEVITTVTTAPPTGMARLREQCAARRGSTASFPTEVAALARLGLAFGEAQGTPPWRVDPTEGRTPIEDARLAEADTPEPWAQALLGRTNACTALHMHADRCAQCRNLPPDSHYDCTQLERLEARWTKHTRTVILATLLLVALIAWAQWLRTLLRTRKEYGTWSQDAIKNLADRGLPVRSDPLRWLFPSRFAVLTADLPDDPTWARWGPRAVLLRASRGRLVHARDVNRAALAALATRAQFSLLVHDTTASLDLGGVRAVLEWAAKGGSRAVHVLPISAERLQWSRGPDDLIDLVEEGSLRQNPFEVRGRIQSSQQFFNRERLVSGLLASVQAGHFTVVTGLRRFGKSSLALEVGRRTLGPTAYVDLAGFHDEFAARSEPGRAADAILRYLCVQLHDAATVRYRDAKLPAPPEAGDAIDATTLATWLRTFGQACAAANGGHPATLLIILDEIEQAIAVGASRLQNALTVLAVLLGRLRNAVPAPSIGGSSGGARVGMLLCSAIDPILWAPLGTLAHQSIMGSFSAVAVPCLPEEAAVSMMRGLGARHGIRFTDAAIEAIVREAQGIPLLVRRIGSAVLELYDPEGARQGSLGAVEVGIEGTTTAIEREEQEGSPLRVWIESEIASPQNPVGVLLRLLATCDSCPADTLRARATEQIRQRFAETGIEATLDPSEAGRRAEEAAGVMVRLLHESGLLVALGDLTNPEAYALPEGVVRRILAQAARKTWPERRTTPANGEPEAPAHGRS